MVGTTCAQAQKHFLECLCCATTASDELIALTSCWTGLIPWSGYNLNDSIAASLTVCRRLASPSDTSTKLSHSVQYLTTTQMFQSLKKNLSSTQTMEDRNLFMWLPVNYGRVSASYTVKFTKRSFMYVRPLITVFDVLVGCIGR